MKKDTIISPYDVTLNNMKVAERKNWSENVFDEIQRELPYESHIYIFASEKYRQYLLPNLEEAGFTCNVPLKGTGFGEQIQYLKNRY
nr:DUF6884 domain-containing protein [Bacillus sp. OK048]